MDGSVTVAATVAYNAATNTATLTPNSALSNSKTYSLVVRGGTSGVKDLAGNALAANVTASFTTAAPAADTTPPTVTAFSPTNGATNVAISVRPTVTFSEAMNASTITTSTVFLRNSSGVSRGRHGCVQRRHEHGYDHAHKQLVQLDELHDRGQGRALGRQRRGRQRTRGRRDLVVHHRRGFDDAREPVE